MPKFLYVLFIALLLASCHCSGVQKTPKTPSALVGKIVNASVALVWTRVVPAEVDENAPVDPDADPPRPLLIVSPYCSGVFVSHDLILTAYHCMHGVAEAEQVGAPENVHVHYVMSFEAPEIGEEPYGVHLGKVEALDELHDLALLRALGTGHSIPAHMSVDIAKEMPGLGEDLFIVGQPKRMYFTVMKGSVAQYRATLPEAFTDRQGSWLQVQAPVYYGNSGGGAFDMNGDLVGIASMLVPMPNAAVFVDANTIRTFVSAHMK
jgi:S1-C subfamily serine protease